jgi:hypothetical protein
VSAVAALLIAFVAPAGASDYAFECAPIGVTGAPPAYFHLAFSADGDAASKIAVDDPHHVLDPYGTIVVYESGGGGMTKGSPPQAKLAFSGGREADGFKFVNGDKVMAGTLTLTPMKGGGYMFKFDARRRMDSTAFSEFTVMGACNAVGAAKP